MSLGATARSEFEGDKYHNTEQCIISSQRPCWSAGGFHPYPRSSGSKRCSGADRYLDVGPAGPFSPLELPNTEQRPRSHGVLTEPQLLLLDLGRSSPAFRTPARRQARSHLVEVVVVPRRRLLASRPQRLQLGVQDVQQLLDEADGRRDVPGLNGTSSQVDQLAGDVGGVLAALDLRGEEALGGPISFRGISHCRSSSAGRKTSCQDGAGESRRCDGLFQSSCDASFPSQAPA